MKASAKYALLGTALALGCLPGFAADENNHEAVGALTPQASVNCAGYSNVLMTADAEQTLPLKVVETLGCNQAVYVVADSTGYTARVRTADGKEGYVARMNLTMSTAGTASRMSSQPPMATPVNGVVRWRAGAAGCDQFTSKGHQVLSASAEGVTVQISLEDTGWKLRTTVAISNKGTEQVEVLPGLMSLDVLRPGLKSLRALPPEKVAHATNHQVLWTQESAQPSPSATVQHATVTNAAYRPATPDYFGEHVVLTSNDGRSASTPAGADLKAIALKHAKLDPGQKTAGLMWFERDTNARELSMRVPVGNLVFDFPLSFEQKK